MKNKKGISLLVLVIIIIVLFILVTAIIVGATNSTEKVKLGVFESELKQIQDAVDSYNIMHNEPPYTHATKIMEQSAIKELVGTANLAKFNEELSLNGDEAGFTTWYRLDFNRLGIEFTTRGNEKTANDIYVFAYPSLNVYYLKGELIEGEMYFSLSPKFPDVEKVRGEQNVDNSQLTITELEGFEVKYSNEQWTNNLKGYIKTNLKSGEELYIKIGDNGALRKIDANLGTYYSNVTNLKRLKNTISTITDDDINSFYNSNIFERNIYYIKKKGEEVTSQIKIPATNLDEILPQITRFESYYNREIMGFYIAENISGVKDVRVFGFDDRMSMLDITQEEAFRQAVSVPYDGSGAVLIPYGMDFLFVLDNAGNIAVQKIGYY